MSDFGIVWSNLWRTPVRTSLLALAVFLSFLIFGLLGSLKAGFDAGVELAGADRLFVIHRINLTLNFPFSYVRQVERVEGVERVSYAHWFGGWYKDERNQLPVFAVEPESYLDLYPEIRVTPEERQAFLSNRTSVLLPRRWAQMQDPPIQVGDTIPIGSGIYTDREGKNAFPFVVAGLYDYATTPSDDSSIYLHWAYLNDFFRDGERGRDRVGWMMVRVADPAQNERIMAEIDGLFANSQDESKTMTEEAFGKQFMAQIGDIGMIVLSITGAALFMSLLIVGTNLAMAIRERTKEIAVLKTLGFSSGRIARMVLGEAVLLSGVAGLLGLGLGSILIDGAKQQIQFLAGLAFTRELWMLGIGAALLLGFLTAFAPAVNALRLNIVAGLGRG